MTGRVVVLGAGPTGLGAAYRMSELGFGDWDIYEGTDHVGGLASSLRDEQGFIWDHGGHVMFSHYTYFDDLVEKMLRGDYDQHMREAWVWIYDRYVPYPFQNNVHRLPKEAFLDSILGIVESQREDLPRRNFEEWVRAIFGRGIAKHFMEPYNFKVWAHPLSMMSTTWQGDRVPTVDLERILRNHLDDRDEVSWGPNNKFKFPLLGTGMLYERIAEALDREVRLEHRVAEIDVVRKAVSFEDGTTTGYDHLVTTLPLTELLRLIPTTPGELLAATDDLHYTNGYFIGIGVAEPCPSSKCWMYFPGEDSPFYRVTYLSNYSPQMTPEGDYFSLLAEVSASPYKAEDASTVVERTIQGMVNCQLLTPEQAATKIVSRELMQVKYSYPVPTLGRDRALAAIQPWLMSNGVYSRGRFGAWRYEIGNTDHSVMMGVEIADHLLSGEPERTWALLPGEEAKAVIA